MTQIKICGITNEEDAMCAAACGAAALGFVFYPLSPRYIVPEAVCQIGEKIPQGIVRVGVFVNENAAEVTRIAELCRLDFIQLHGDESIEYCRNFPQSMIIKAVNLRSENDLMRVADFEAAAILADSRHDGLYGGTGRKSDWELARRLKNRKPLILSGGLNASNVRDALAVVAPRALDINSGVELEPGKKDPRKIFRVFEVLRSVDLRREAAPLIFTKREKQ